MNLSAALAAPPSPLRKGPACSVTTLLASLNDENRAALLAALDLDSGWSHADLARKLREVAEAEAAEATAAARAAAADPSTVAPIPPRPTPKQNTLNRHRNRECQCP